MQLNPIQFYRALRDMNRQGGMYLCEACIRNQIGKVSPEDQELAYRKSMDSGMYKVMEIERPCFVCESPTKTMVMIKDAMKAIGRASNKQGQV